MDTETIIIEADPSGAPFECCINSVNYRIERGVPVKVPREVAELYRSGLSERRKSESRLNAFRRAEGMKL
ncbi:MAG: hypothetical protein IKI64_11300 [Clostridia bacterium]|nr:hypothetical protein [Clostridia bacterium]